MTERPKKTEVEQLNQLSIYDLTSRGWLVGITPSTLRWRNYFLGEVLAVDISIFVKNGELFCGLQYELADLVTGAKKYCYAIPVSTTPCRKGGSRWWFHCPAQKDGVMCRRRVASLFMKDGIFACRHCHNLTYASRNKNRRRPENVLLENLKDYQAMEKLLKDIKTPYYRGKPTKKYQQFKELQARVMARSDFTTKR
ncbi:MAG: hypothetical protein V2A66_01060 [Pseudomonadota bacterium]